MTMPQKNHLFTALKLLKDGEIVSLFRRLYYYIFGDNLLLSKNLKPFSHSYNRISFRSGKRAFVAIVLPNLNLEGAPLSAIDLATEFKRIDKFDLIVLSPSDGPLRSRLISEGIDIEIIGNLWPDFVAEKDYCSRVKKLSDWLRSRKIDGVLGVTLNSFPAMDAAVTNGMCLIWNIRESSNWREILADRNPKIAARALGLFRVCQSIIFVAQSSLEGWRYFTSKPEALQLIRNPMPSLVADKEVTRRIKETESELMLLNVGTVCERKGQIDLILVADKLQKQLNRKIKIFFVGQTDEKYLLKIKHFVPIHNDKVAIQFTGSILDVSALYTKAHIFINCARQEAFPRVLFEATNHNLPIIATNVDGISELLKDEESALFYKPGALDDLCSSIIRLANDKKLGKKLSMKATKTLLQNGDLQQIANKYCDIILASLQKNTSNA